MICQAISVTPSRFPVHSQVFERSIFKNFAVRPVFGCYNRGMNTRIHDTGERFIGFSEDTFAFLQALAFNNERAWFESHRSDWERLVLAPSLALIRDMEGIIRGISPHYTAIAKKTGGSLMRIYRDTRFGADKTPYKTNIGIQFRHESYRDVHAPGFYVHLAPDSCFVGAGSWRPERDDLAKIRARIAERPKEYRGALESAAGEMDPVGDSLSRVPRGFDADHPLAAELKRTDFLVSRDLAPEVYMDRELIFLLGRKFSAAVPYMKFLCAALGARFS